MNAYKIDGVFFNKPWLEGQILKIDHITLENNTTFIFCFNQFDNYRRWVKQLVIELPEDIDFFIPDDSFDMIFSYCTTEKKGVYSTTTTLVKNRLIPDKNSLFFYNGRVYKLDRKCWFQGKRYYAAYFFKDKVLFSGCKLEDMETRNKLITYWFHSRNGNSESIVRIENEDNKVLKEITKIFYYPHLRLSK